MPDFAPFAARMRAEGLPDLAVDAFAHNYAKLVRGETGLIPEAELQPVESLRNAEDFAGDPDLLAAGREVLPRTIVLKLNGGLGTGMGLEKAKSLLEVKDGLTFLDIIARQSLHLDVPLVLMNSFSTREDSLAALAAYPRLRRADVPLDFVQNKVPKIRRDDLAPAEHPADPSLTWCPPGHGDLYTALLTTGLLDDLVDGGYRYAFVSNSDNLGAVIEPGLLGWFAESGAPFLMECADRTPADRKGGHLARRRDGRLMLRELAQCPDDDLDAFQDVARHRYFNTNSLWLHLPAVRDALRAAKGVLDLPLIRNGKTVDPRDKQSTPVWQLETAMGSAIEAFPGADAVRVPPSRFAPIKRTSDLLDVRSDNFVLTDDHRVVPNPERRLGRCVVELDGPYAFVDQLEARFPYGPPSLKDCARLALRGDVRFGRGVTVTGAVTLSQEGEAPRQVPDGTVVAGD
ncbi:MAG TPA: UTP--glucose-1-phosphate uridylyltransferase [Candidatus Krumholzibacteria bacterium]|nr:UTP--glucose-1-phosphate uridylyltransferase [Candidatus Krumholzibacteria bacterium]